MDRYITDAHVPNLKVRKRTGRQDTYLFVWHENGRTRRMVLGKKGSMTAGNARAAARYQAQRLAEGLAPQSRGTATRSKPTVKDLYAAWSAEYGSQKKTAAEDNRMFNKYCCDLHNVFVHELQRVDVKTTVERIAAPTQSNRVLALLSVLCNYAKNSDDYDLSHNPCDGLRRNKEVSRTRLLSEQEIKLFIDTLETYRADRPDAYAFLMLLVHTGARKSELSNMRWGDIKHDRIELREHKTDRTGHLRIIQLSDAAQEIIRALPRGRSMDDHVLRVRNPRALFERVCKDAGIEDFRIHDIRHLYASIAAMAGRSLAEVGAMLGHRNTSTTARYAHFAGKQLNGLANQVSDILAEQANAGGSYRNNR